MFVGLQLACLSHVPIRIRGFSFVEGISQSRSTTGLSGHATSRKKIYLSPQLESRATPGPSASTKNKTTKLESISKPPTSLPLFTRVLDIKEFFNNFFQTNSAKVHSVQNLL